MTADTTITILDSYGKEMILEDVTCDQVMYCLDFYRVLDAMRPREKRETFMRAGDEMTAFQFWNSGAFHMKHRVENYINRGKFKRHISTGSAVFAAHLIGVKIKWISKQSIKFARGAK